MKKYKNKLLIICRYQFGYHTDRYKWAEYLRSTYDITFITLAGRPKIFMDGVTTKYVKSIGPRFLRGFMFVLYTLWNVLLFKGQIIICYYPGCEIYKKLMPWKKMILDLRTLTVTGDKAHRAAGDKKIKECVDLYDYVTAISEGLRDKIGAPKEKTAILPLGADIVSSADKCFNDLNLLYVGTFMNRDLDKTVRGYAKALKQLPSEFKIHYYMIGNGFNGELEQYRELAKDLGIENYITLPGFIQHEELKYYFDKCNVGVSFVPITDYFEYQPVTKTYECILSGLYTIATATYSNKEIINDDNGILIQDTEDDFARAIVEIYNKRNILDNKKVRETLCESQWKFIVQNIMVDILKRFK